MILRGQENGNALPGQPILPQVEPALVFWCWIKAGVSRSQLLECGKILFLLELLTIPNQRLQILTKILCYVL